MRILVATVTCDRSEAAMFRELSAGGFQVDLVCDPAYAGGDELAAQGIGVSSLGIRHRMDLRASNALRTRLREQSYDLVYAPRNKTLSTSLWAARGMNIPIVAYRGTTGHLSHWDPASWITYLNPGIRKIVCVSNAVRDYLLGMRIPEGRLQTVYKGHDPAWYDFADRPGLSQFGIPEGAFVVGFTGSMRPVKGVDVLIRSVEHLPASANVHFLLVGDVRDRKIQSMAAQGRAAQLVHFTGFRKDAAALAGACDAFAMPSIEREGLPRSVIEAMAQGVPPVVSGVGGLPELVTDKESGLVVPPKDPAALANAIMHLAEKPERCKELGAGARERIETRFNIRDTVQQISDLFSGLAQATDR